MEHRYSARRPSNLTVTVSAGSIHAVGRLLNLSTQGFYIATDSRVFTTYQRVDVDIILKKAGRITSHQFRGRILRRDPRGMALELEAESGIVPRGMPALLARLEDSRIGESSITESSIIESSMIR